MITKYLIPIAIVISVSGGTYFGAKVLAPKPIDYDKIRVMIQQETTKIKLECPPAVSLNSFDADKLNNKKGNFHLHNNISNVQIKIEAKDSVLMKQILMGSR